MKPYLIAGWSSLVARQAHNLKVVRFKSHPRNQKTQVVRNGDFFFILQALIKVRMFKCQKRPFS